MLKAAAADLEVNTFDEAVALGDAAAASSEWEKALDAYSKALEIAEKTKLKNPGGIAAVREADRPRPVHDRPRSVQQGQVERVHRDGRARSFATRRAT